MTYIITQKRNCGFFSDFNTIVGSLNHIRKHAIQDYYFIWNNIFYQNNDNNMFDEYFFEQPKTSYLKDIQEKTAVELGWPPIVEAEKKMKEENDLSGFQELHETLNHFKYFENKIYKECKEKVKLKPKTLGIHVRQTDHWGHGQLLPPEYYFYRLEERLSNYENIFLATDEIRIINEFVRRYGDKVYFNEDIIRSDNHQPIHTGKYIHHREKLSREVMIDAISLSLCDETIITSSNISHYIFIINPQIKFYKIDNHIKYE